ncbi:MAG: hypothetical protein LC745_05735, partial [Planctomycetia bacterium]|nr:hypothetical protein [Planctomycetia bacterium]
MISGALDVREMVIVSGRLGHRTPAEVAGDLRGLGLDPVADDLQELSLDPREAIARSFGAEFRKAWERVEAVLTEHFSFAERSVIVQELQDPFS